MSNRIPQMLVIAPHPDDSVLGVGGTMARFAKNGGEVTVLTIASHMPPLYSEEVFHLALEEAQKAHAIIGVKESIFLNLPALSVAQVAHHELNLSISNVLQRVCPSVLMLPYIDRHVDHRAVFESGMVASRPILSGKAVSVVAVYEVLSSTYYNAPYIEPNFTPNWTVDISDFIDTKVEALRCFSSQIGPMPSPRSCEALHALALFRGSQAGMSYGEGFYILRMAMPPEALA